MKITKTQLKNLIKEEIATMSEADTPKSTAQTLEAIRARLEQYLKTQDDVQEIIPLIMGLLAIIRDLNPQDFTDSEHKRSLDLLIRAVMGAKREPDTAQPDK